MTRHTRASWYAVRWTLALSCAALVCGPVLVFLVAGFAFVVTGAMIVVGSALDGAPSDWPDRDSQAHQTVNQRSQIGGSGKSNHVVN